MFRRSRLSLALVGLLAISGCGTSESDIVGTWKLDADATKSAARNDLQAKNASKEEIDMAMSMIDGFAEHMTFDFKADKTVNGFPMVSGTWKLDGSNVVVTSMGNNVTMNYSGGKLSFTPQGESQPVVLKKA